MSSLGDIQQIHGMLQEISRLLDEVDTKTEIVTTKSASTTRSLMQLEQVTLRYLVLARSMGLPDDVDNAIQLVTRLITTIRMAQLSINMLMASNPITSAIGVAGLIMTVATLPDMLAGY